MLDLVLQGYKTSNYEALPNSATRACVCVDEVSFINLKKGGLVRDC